MHLCKEEKKKKVGISGLAIGLGGNHEPDTIYIDDIGRKLKRDRPLLAEHYIKVDERTSSQLSVPILGKSLDGETPRKLGVITLEHQNKYAFTSDYVSVVKQFAQHVAIAYGRQINAEEVAHKRQIVSNLHNTLEVIVNEPLQSMLYKAVTQVREALRAKSVYVVPILYEKTDGMRGIYEKDEPRIQWLKCSPVVEESFKNKTFEVVSKVDNPSGDKDSFKGDNSRDQGNHIEEFSFHYLTKKVFRSQAYERLKSGKDLAYCFPFSSADECLGVVWILLSQSASLPKHWFDEEVKLISSYVNQIALSYTNSTQFNDRITRSYTDLDRQIKENHTNARRQSNYYFILAFFSSWAGLILLLLGIFMLYMDGKSNSRMRLGLFSAGTGLALEACAILVFRRIEATNKRLDQYHSERLNIGQLNILLSASEQVPQADSLKFSLIESAKAKWLSRSEGGKDE